MTEKEFIIWFKGFVEACHDYQPTPKQWQQIKEELAKVTPDTYTDPTKGWWWIYPPYEWTQPFYTEVPYKTGDQVPDPHPVTCKKDNEKLYFGPPGDPPNPCF